MPGWGSRGGSRRSGWSTSRGATRSGSHWLLVGSAAKRFTSAQAIPFRCSGTLQQYHEVKEETVSVQSGRLLFEVGPSEDALERFELLPGEAVHLLPGTRHRMTALEDTVVLEASTTELNDVVRLEDRYGRAAGEAP